MNKEQLKLLEKQAEIFLKKEISKNVYCVLEQIEYSLEFNGYTLCFRIGETKNEKVIWQKNIEIYFNNLPTNDIIIGTLYGYYLLDEIK